MPKFVVSEGEEFEIEFVSRLSGSSRSSVFKVNSSGVVYINDEIVTSAGLINSDAGNIEKVGVAADAGSVGTAADAGHVHQLDSAVFMTAVHLGRNGAGAVTGITGTKVGDKVLMALNLTDDTNDASKFESTITVADEVQQSSATDLSAKKILFFILHQS